MTNILRSFRDSALFYRRKRAICRDWRNRHARVLALHPEYGRLAPGEIEAQHRSLWAPVAKVIDPTTFRICWNIAGAADFRIVPEEVFASYIEPRLVPQGWARHFSHKSLYSMLFPRGPFPENYLNLIAGEYFTGDLLRISRSQAMQLIDNLKFPVVAKPAVGSCGGKGVCFPSSPDELRILMDSPNDIVVQRIIQPHAFFNAFNPHGLNSIRVYTFRSIGTGKVHVLNAAFRMGKGGSLDNETAGGIVCFLNSDGSLNQFAVDKYGAKFTFHPDTGIPFGRKTSIPDYGGLADLAKSLADHLPIIRLVGWDMAMEGDGQWRCLEANLFDHTIRFAQYAGRPFFGDLTEEVLEYCLAHQLSRNTVSRIY